MLTAISRLGSNWLCKCDCGKTSTLKTARLTGGHTKSCGCLRATTTRKMRLKHGMTKSRTHDIWAGMKIRCHTKTNNHWKWYGARGIFVCDRWRHSFENFFADMGVAPPGHSLERIDNDGPYEPSNCRWASHAEQSRNKRTTRWLVARGERRSLSEWASITGIKQGVIGRRLKRGWSHEDAIFIPLQPPMVRKISRGKIKGSPQTVFP